MVYLLLTLHLNSQINSISEIYCLAVLNGRLKEIVCQFRYIKILTCTKIDGDGEFVRFCFLFFSFSNNPKVKTNALISTLCDRTAFRLFQVINCLSQAFSWYREPRSSPSAPQADWFDSVQDISHQQIS